jgi:hypothetical protein
MEEEEARISDAENTSCSRIPGRQGLAKWACGQTAAKTCAGQSSDLAAVKHTGKRRKTQE